jgi:uncharacterized protein (DUF1697 family)
MPKYVAFLRAINVGSHTVKMDSLRSLFEALGFSNVETFINSGNVIFDSKSKAVNALEKKIEAHLRQSLGYEVPTFVRSTAEVSVIAAYKPFVDEELNAEGNTLYIGFLSSTPSQDAQQKLLSLATSLNDFHVMKREVYWLIRTKFSDAAFSGAQLEKTLGMKTTLRNSTTVKKIRSKYP